MLYSDYLKDKSHNAIKLNDVEGIPCILTHSKGKDLKNYEIYGNSYQAIRSGKNLLHADVTTLEFPGVTLTYDNGTITLNGTCTTSANFELGNIVLSAGTYTLSANANKVPVSNDYAFVQLYDSTNNQIIQVENSRALGNRTVTTSLDGKFAYRIRIDEGTTYDNVVLKPQLEVGSTATEYEQYGVMPSPEFPSEVQSVGDLTTKNLINESAIKLSSGYWSDVDGHPIGNNSRFIMISSVKCNPNETYTLSSNLNIYSIWFFNNDTAISKTYRKNTVAVFTTPENCNSLRISLVNTSGNTDTIAFKWIQLEEGSTATEYEPYHKYKVPIKVSGKNLLSKWYSNTYYTACTKSKAIYMEPGTYNYHFERVDDTVTKWRYALSIFDVDGGESDRITGVYSYLAYRSTNGWYCSDYGIVQSTGDVTYSGSANVALTILKPCYIMWMLQLKNSSGTILDAKKYAKNVMLEKGEQYTGYEDYAEPMSKNIYLDEPLRKVGDCADYIDYKNQKVVRNVKEITLNGSEKWTEYITYNGFWYQANDMKPQNKGYGYSNYYSYVTTPLDFGIRFGADNNLLYFTQMYTPETPLTLDDWKAKLAEWNTGGNPLIVYYILATPTEESISLPTLKTVKGTSIMTVDTSIQSSNIKTKYVRL